MSEKKSTAREEKKEDVARFIYMMLCGNRIVVRLQVLTYFSAKTHMHVQTGMYSHARI